MLRGRTATSRAPTCLPGRRAPSAARPADSRPPRARWPPSARRTVAPRSTRSKARSPRAR
ncbi:MAG: hypothetical protein FJ286_03435 [Planctomycetes bacterium]|nr:hypothetical protein [Planctomycetota bacterium]